MQNQEPGTDVLTLFRPTQTQRQGIAKSQASDVVGVLAKDVNCVGTSVHDGLVDSLLCVA